MNTIKVVPNETFLYHFRCECNKGYKPHIRDEKLCVDEDECIVNGGGCDHMCTNVEVRILYNACYDKNIYVSSTECS